MNVSHSQIELIKFPTLSFRTVQKRRRFADSRSLSVASIRRRCYDNNEENCKKIVLYATQYSNVLNALQQ